MAATQETIDTLEEATGKYKYGFVTDIESDKAPKGLNEDIIRFISAKKDEPQWMLDWRLKAFATWQTMESPDWAKLEIEPIDYQDIHYYSAPKSGEGPASLDEVDPEFQIPPYELDPTDPDYLPEFVPSGRVSKEEKIADYTFFKGSYKNGGVGFTENPTSGNNFTGQALD